MQTIECPKCKAKLPAWAQHCQFCNTPLANVPRPAGTPARAGYDNRMPWQEIAYIAVSIIMLLLGGYNFVTGVLLNVGEGGAFIGIMGAIQAVLAIGLLAQQTWAQFIMKWFCILRILSGIFTLLMGALFMGANSNLLKGFGVVILILGIVELIVCGFMMYLISYVGDVDFM